MNRNTWSLEYLFQNLIRFWFNLKSEVYYQTQNFQTLSCQFRDYSQPKSGFGAVITERVLVFFVTLLARETGALSDSQPVFSPVLGWPV